MLDDCLFTCQSAIYDGYVMDCGEICYSPGDACFDTCDTDQSQCLELAVVCAELCESSTFEACVLAWISATMEY